MSKLLYSLLFLFFSQALFSQDFTVRGFIYDKSNGEAMAYEKVKLLNTDSSVVAGAVSDINGFFSIPKLIIGTYILKIENQKYERAYKNIIMNAKTKIYDVKFELIKKENIKEFDEIKVSAESKTKRTQVGISELKLDQKSLERIPSYGAENDIVGAFSVTPGVVTVIRSWRNTNSK